MRTETEMLDLILNTARADERIRAVILNGSRANPIAHRDPFQDFDIVYVVTDMASFKSKPDWIDCFGERMILQLPDDMPDPPPDDHPGYTYLIQFMDGNRIDLNLHPLDKLDQMEEDSLSITLLDKDNALPEFPPPSERDYLPQPPTAKQFDDCCNEFWWVSPYVAKGLWRQQIVYAMQTLEIVREQLLKMVVWYIGVQTNFAKNTGGYGKYIPRHLDPELWARLQQSWCTAEIGSVWEALFQMGELFRYCGHTVGDHCGYTYPQEDDRRVSAHLKHVQELPNAQ
jgi:aminoglycoside 6-adenylyltransferase